mgnify:FL=1
MMIRSTTNGVLKSYRYNLQRSSYTLNKAMNTVLTGRNFDTYAADPATAARCFQMRRSFQRVNSQYSVSESVTRKYEQAWSALGSVVDDVNNQKTSSAYQDILHSINDPTASGRNSLGQSLTELAKGIVQTMNGRYGDNFIFAGADGLKVPFTWGEDGTLCYRGIPVDAAVPDIAMSNGAPLTLNDQGQYDPAGTNYLLSGGVKTISVDDYEAAVKAGNAPTVLRDTTGAGQLVDADGNISTTERYYLVLDNSKTISKADYEQAEKDLASLDYLSKSEVKYADLGLGLQEDGKSGEVIGSSVFNVALQGINFLGYGVDADGDPKNIVSIISRMGQILLNCDATTGAFAEGERDEFQRLADKFEASAALLQDKHIELDTQADFLKSNQTQLESMAYTLEQQFLGIEDVDPAEAISQLSWAKYCYNTALKVGNSILSQSLMDYINA